MNIMWVKHQWANEAVFYHEKLSLNWIYRDCNMVYYNLEKSTTKLINFVFPSFWLQFRFLCSSFSSIFDFRFSLIRYQKEERTKMHQSQLSRSADKAWVKGRKLQQGPHLNDPEQAKQKLLILIRQQTKKTLAPRET